MPSTGKLRAGYIELHFACEICKRPRSQGNHDKCSKARQREHTQRNEP